MLTKMRTLFLLLFILPIFCQGQIISWWGMNGNVTDKLGTNNGVAHNVTYVNGKDNQGVSLATSNSYVAMPGNSFSFANTTFTVSFWVNNSSSTASARVFLSLNNQNSGWGVLQMVTSGVLQFRYRDASGGACSFQTTQTFNDSKWHNIIIVATTNTTTTASNSVIIYFDGGVISHTPTLTRPYASPSDSLRIGVNSTLINSISPSVIDEVIIENRAWTATEIKQYYIDNHNRFSQ